jgi:nucleotide-binding universal stress UspA family protein
MKDLIVKLELEQSHERALDYAISVAEVFNAHIAGVAFGNLAGLPDYSMIGVPGEVIGQIMAESEKTARAAITRFEAAAKRSELASESHLVVDREYGAAETFAEFARHFDLSIVGQSEDDGPDNDLIIEAALFNTGRPVLVVPMIQTAGLKLDRVLCCWDGSRGAARAVNDAIPFLKKAKVVEVFSVANERERDAQDAVRGVEIADHLARHGVKVEIETLPAPDIDVANTILSHVADISADLMVMGGYGHSRFREFVLGGVTREILQSMTLPVLMSH